MLVAEQHGEARWYHALGQPGDALAGDAQVILMQTLMFAQFLRRQHMLFADPVRVEAVLHHAAVPGSGDLFVRMDAALRK